MNLVVDTNILSDFFKAEAKATTTITKAAKVYVPAIVIGEYKYGIYGGTRRKHNLELLNGFLAKSNVLVAEINAVTAEHYGQLRAYLRANGTPIPVNDIWISALCVQFDLPLLTRDHDFNYLPQVERI